MRKETSKKILFYLHILNQIRSMFLQNFLIQQIHIVCKERKKKFGMGIQIFPIIKK